MANTPVNWPIRTPLRVTLVILCGTILVVVGFVLWRAPSHRVDGEYGAPTVLGRIESAEVDESSGLAASRRNPGLLWTLNSDPQDQFLFCLEPDGGHCGVWLVPVTQEGDWEDIAIGPGPAAGKPYVYIGDIGDNAMTRREIRVYRVREPAVAAADESSSEDAPLETGPVEEFRFEYPDGPHDAETLMVHPRSGALYVVTKHETLASVYRAPAPVASSGVVRLDQVASIRSEMITAGNISPDGRRVVLCSKARAYELVLRDPSPADFDSIWDQELAPVPMAPGEQREGCAYRLDGDAIISTSEGPHRPVYEVELQG